MDVEIGARSVFASLRIAHECIARPSQAKAATMLLAMRASSRIAAYAVDAAVVFDRGTVRRQRRELHAQVLQNPSPSSSTVKRTGVAPCKHVGTILEAEVAKTQGKVLLATLDVDAEQNSHGVRNSTTPDGDGLLWRDGPERWKWQPARISWCRAAAAGGPICCVVISRWRRPRELPEDATQARCRPLQLLDAGNPRRRRGLPGRVYKIKDHGRE